MWRLAFAAMLAVTCAASSVAQVVVTPDSVEQALRAGRIANAGGQYEEAERAFGQALELEAKPPRASDSAVAGTLLDLALNVGNQGRFDEADGLYRRAGVQIDAANEPALRARLATYLALNESGRGTRKVALDYARDAVRQWARIVADRQRATGLTAADATVAASEQGEYANALTLLARLELRQDDLLAAYGAASQALLILNQTTRVPGWWKADALLALGEISIAQGRLSAAESYFDNALKIRRQLFGNGVPTIKVLVALGQAYQREGLNSSAIVTYREVFRLARALPTTAGVFDAEMLAPFVAAVSVTAATLDDPVKRNGLYAEAFDAFQLVQSSVVERTIAQAAARQSAATPAIAALVGEVQTRQRALDRLRLTLAHRQSLPALERSDAEEVQLGAEISAAAAAVAAPRAELSARYPAYETLAAPQAVRLDPLRAMLKPGEGVISFLIGRDASFAQLVTREGVTVAPVAQGEAGLRDAVDQLRRPLQGRGGTVAEFDLGAAHRLYALLFGGLEPKLRDVQRLIVVPAGPLSNLPFGMLVTRPAISTDYTKADWLIRSRPIAYTPSLTALARLRSAAQSSKATRPFLGFGNPTLDGARGRGDRALQQLSSACRSGGPMPAALLRGLAALPDTAAELNAVAQAVEGNHDGVFLGAWATEAALRGEQLGDYRILYFATHGLLPGELRCQAEPGLVLTPPSTAINRANDGLLETSEISALRINADLVVLSACDTAADSDSRGGGDALTGLAEAFFHAGARNLVVSHWQVSSTATTALMTRMFQAWRPGGSMGPAEALRESQLAMLADPRTAHPFFWAAFTTVGDGLGEPPASAVAAR